ncbi:MAG: 3-deoxy-D-manno-octulosonic acid transferase [Xanthomonadales bacterium]|nr:lipid IV(A) 3-deoxy-D-manno-octulosonic acid transferase [Gammaproteobacteria bacterium]MBT8050910.1 lipid IV(A) 3-deoxy-D-manno-octulosonic acid transferase [Gammaproteobacteria bacterium]NNJ78680.1 3-deoxy-D-manno-octulosonic acid transferase [Xanthomonadales bacterium]NNL05694.1 3-deoxy-D-manno-octulosonic acid transferase [Xanthomonadales bacterium]
MRALYSLLLYLSVPPVLGYLFFRGFRSAGYRKRWSERFARFDREPPTGGIWVHAVSMGEVNAASALIDALKNTYPDRPLIITTFTPTGSDRVRALFGDSVYHAYAPFDLPGAVHRFYTRVQPALAVILETEIWPNLYHGAASRNIPLVIVNARISHRSFGRYLRLRRLVGPALCQVRQIAAQSDGDARRLEAIGAPPERITVTGNLKFDFRLPPGIFEEGESIRTAWGTQRRALVAGSTHEAEELILLRTFAGLKQDYPDALLVLVPRHPERFARAADAARGAGLQVALRSKFAACPADTDCYVIDAMGELLRYYAAGDIAFVGGSLEPIGGHNVLEPAALARPVLVGPHTFNFADITQQLVDAQAAIQVADEPAFEAALSKLLMEPETRDRMGRAGAELVKSGQGAVGRTLSLIGESFTREAG